MRKQGKRRTFSKPFKATIVVVAAIISCFIGVVAFAFSHGDNICKGVRVNDVDIGNMSVDNAAAVLKMHFNTAGKLITIKVGDREEQISPDEIGLEILTEQTAQTAANLAKTGNLFKSFGDSLRYTVFGHSIPLEVVCDRDRFVELAKQIGINAGSTVQQYSAAVEGNQLKVTNGMPGMDVDPNLIVEVTLAAISANNWEPLLFTPTQTDPTPVDVESLHAEIYTQSEDAHYIVENYKLELMDESVGIDFDKSVAQKIISDNTDFGATYSIPLTITQPNVTKQALSGMLFRDKLSTFQTRYNAGDRNRSSNLELASAKINGVVLAPGDNFSYNTIVGDRTYSEGFADAKVVLNGKLVDGVGGGVCQVSSTLYNAVLNANLKIVTRVNHQLTVGYVPMGQDATVAYGSIDFVFKNTNEYPVRIAASAQSGSCKMEIYGTVDSEFSKISKINIENTLVKTVPFTVETLPDPSLPLGETKSEQRGGVGHVVDSFRVITKKDGTVEREPLGRSTYRATQQITRTGTGAPAPAPSPKTPTESTPTIATPPESTPDAPVETNTQPEQPQQARPQGSESGL